MQLFMGEADLGKKVEFPCIIPILTKDYQEIRQHLYMLLEMLPVNRLIFIGSNELKDLVYEDTEHGELQGKVDFLSENDILSFVDVKRAYDHRLAEIETHYGKPGKISRSGWYYQQFIKMEYCNHCDYEYYLCWDADTIPLHSIEMFGQNGEPYLDIKTEYRPSYFTTLHNLLGLNKVIEKSFISEHMLFKKNLMSELIEEIMSAPLFGNTFYEKIFSAIEQPFNGFSEFETYGTWIANKHSDEYRLRYWRSLRNANFLVDRNNLTKEDLEWLATGFDAASFERYQETQTVLTEIFRNPRYREKLTADVFYRELLEAGVFGDYENGGLRTGEVIAPV